MFMRYIGGGVGHQDIAEIQLCNEEVDEMEVDAEPQNVCGDVEDSDSEGDSSDGEDSHVSGEEDFEDCDPDDEDIGSDIDDRYDEL